MADALFPEIFCNLSHLVDITCQPHHYCFCSFGTRTNKLFLPIPNSLHETLSVSMSQGATIYTMSLKIKDLMTCVLLFYFYWSYVYLRYRLWYFDTNMHNEFTTVKLIITSMSLGSYLLYVWKTQKFSISKL